MCPAASGRPSGLDDLFDQVYGEIKTIARHCLLRERADHTLQPTALVNEAYLKFRKRRDLGVDNRDAFLRIAVKVMRQILVDHARRKSAAKRGGKQAARVAIDLDAVALELDQRPVDALAVHEALTQLAGMDERKAAIVELRVFGGLTIPEIATVLGSSTRTVERDWSFSRCWLGSRLEGSPAGSDATVPMD